MLPNFLIVGAHKSATTALHHYAREHPAVFLPEKKEPRFFIADYFRELTADYPRRQELLDAVVFTRADYEALFSGVTGETAVGEASPQYLYFHAMAIPEIRALLGTPKIAMILRNPVERAHSAYALLRRSGVLDLDFDTFLDREAFYAENRYPPFFHVVRMGFYAAQVRAYRQAFPDVRVMLHDDLESRPGPTVAGFFDWLGVDPGFAPMLQVRHNVGEGKAPLAPRIRHRLLDLYRDDIRILEDDLGRDLSAWRS